METYEGLVVFHPEYRISYWMREGDSIEYIADKLNVCSKTLRRYVENSKELKELYDSVERGLDTRKHRGVTVDLYYAFDDYRDIEYLYA